MASAIAASSSTQTWGVGAARSGGSSTTRCFCVFLGVRSAIHWLVRPRSPEHNAALPVQLVEIEEELVAPVSAEADNVALVNHERHVRVFDGRHVQSPESVFSGSTPKQTSFRHASDVGWGHCPLRTPFSGFGPEILR